MSTAKISLSALLVLCALSGASNAALFPPVGPDYLAASACKPSFRSSGSVHYFDGELFNEGSNTMFVDCPPTVLPNAFSYHVVYVDNNANANANLRCYSYQSVSNGQFAVSQSRFSCASADGCPTNSDPGFASNTRRTLNIPGGMGLTCEVPPGISIKHLQLWYDASFL
jgi:hypothetical protein